MRRRSLVTLSILCCFLSVEAQEANFEDGFEDGNFSGSPQWTGSGQRFAVAPFPFGHLLQLDSPDTETAWLSTPSSAVTGFWEFYVEMDGFAPSGSNRAEIFLMSDRPDLREGVNGYAVQVGQTGEDRFRIVRFDDGDQAAVVLEDDRAVGSRGGGYRVRVVRSAAGEWSIETAEGYLGELSGSGTTVTDAVHGAATHFGVRVHYTTTRSDRFLFDFRIDRPPFRVTGFTPGPDRLELVFSDSVDPASVQPSDFRLIPDPGLVPQVTFPSGDRIRADFPDPLPSGDYLLEPGEIRDRNGQAAEIDTEFRFAVFGTHGEGDIRIGEFAWDPPEGAPEYVELENRSGKIFNMAGWQVGDDSRLVSIASDTLRLDPGSRLVLTSDTVMLKSVWPLHGPLHRVTGFPFLNNTGDAVRLVTPSGLTADSLQYDPSWGGAEGAVERRSFSLPSVLKENWGAAPGDPPGSPGLPNRVAADTVAPALLDVTVTGGRTIDLHFSERLEPKSAGEVGAYRLQPAAWIASAAFTAPDSVRLHLAGDLQNATRYTLSVTGVTDLFGNAAEADTAFTWHEISAASPGDLHITEFMYDPPDGWTEYVELWNGSKKSVDLSTLSIADGSGAPRPVSADPLILPPGSRMVLAPDPALLDSFPDIGLADLGSRFPVLNNGGDRIILSGAGTDSIDSLEYQPEWGGEGHSLERRSTAVAAIHPENWSDAPAGSGTPGMPNAVTRDEIPPRLVVMQIVNSTQIRLTFSERLFGEDVTESDRYRLQPDHAIRMVAVRDATVDLFLESSLRSGTIYTVTVEGLTDLFGNRMGSESLSAHYLAFEPAGERDIVINEILFLEDSRSPEFVELVNISKRNIDLSDWTLSDATGSVILPAGTAMEPGEYLVMSGDPQWVESVPNGVHLPDMPVWNNDGDRLALADSGTQIIDSVRYAREWGGVSPGISLERVDPEALSHDPANWTASRADGGATPGAVNSAWQPDRDPPSLLFARVLTRRTLELVFDEFVAPTPETLFAIGSQALEVESFNPLQADRMILRSAADLDVVATDQPPRIRVRHLSDARGNAGPEQLLPLAFPPGMGDLAINEILYAPISRPGDGQTDQAEYIELFNRRSRAISLEGIRIHDAPDEDGEVRVLQPADDRLTRIPGDGYALLYADTTRIFRESRTWRWFEPDTAHPRARLRFARASMGLSSPSDAVYLADSIGAVIDSVHYREDWHNPNRPDTRGIALERIDPDGSAMSSLNWSSSTADRGGTPLARNSIHRTADASDLAQGIRLSPNPFSPDGDGHEDHLGITWRLDSADYLLTVRIHDRYGRMIRTLADGVPAGPEGVLLWDGLRDDRRGNRIGIYIVTVEAYNAAIGRTLSWKETAVLARRLR